MARTNWVLDKVKQAKMGLMPALEKRKSTVKRNIKIAEAWVRLQLRAAPAEEPDLVQEENVIKFVVDRHIKPFGWRKLEGFMVRVKRTTSGHYRVDGDVTVWTMVS